LDGAHPLDPSKELVLNSSVGFRLLAAMLLLLGASAPSLARGQAGSRPPSASDRRPQKAGEAGALSLQGGLGFTADPDAFLLEFEGDFGLGNGFSIGPALQLGVDDNLALVSPTLFGRYSVDLRGTTHEHLRRMTPYAQFGLGLTHIDKENRRRDRDDTGFLMNLGFGVDYAVTKNVSFGSRMLFNILPEDVLNENFYYSWQVAAIRYRF
jgi:hypothetical protein